MTTDQNRYLCFNLGTEEFAIPLLDVKEVIGVPHTTPVPQAPPHFVGIMNLRGEVLSILDLRVKMGIDAKVTGETAVIILELNSFKIGVLVDRINSVQNFSAEMINEKPRLENAKSQDAILGVVRSAEKLILLLNIAQTLSLEDKATAQSSAKKSAVA